MSGITRDEAEQQVRDKFADAADAVITLNRVTYDELDKLAADWKVRFNKARESAPNMTEAKREDVAQAAANEATAINDAREAKSAGNEEAARQAVDRAAVARDEFNQLVGRVDDHEGRITSLEERQSNQPAPVSAPSPAESDIVPALKHEDQSSVQWTTRLVDRTNGRLVGIVGMITLVVGFLIGWASTSSWLWGLTVGVVVGLTFATIAFFATFRYTNAPASVQEERN